MKNKLIRHTLVPLSLALALSAMQSHAAGLGRLSVLSGLGQPLRAEVDISAVGKEESSSLQAKLASPEAFRQVGLDYNPALQGLKFIVQKRANRHVVVISSSQPINEPFVDLLLELSWSGGRVIREYTFLLDPPELRASKDAINEPAAAPSKAAEARSVDEPTQIPVQPLPAPTREALPADTGEPETLADPLPKDGKPAGGKKSKAAAKASATAAEPKANGDTVEVRRGDTLVKIAQQHRYEGVSLDQMLVALYQGNTAAFSGNMNRLKEGARLAVPDRDTVGSVQPGEARKQVRLHAANFAQFRDRLAGAAQRNARGEKPARGSNVASGKIGTELAEKAKPTETPQDELKVSRPKKADLAKEEMRIAKEKAAAEAKERVAALEKNVDDLQRLVEIKNQAAADSGRREGAKAELPVPAASIKDLEPGIKSGPGLPPAIEPVKPAESASPAEAKTEAAPDVAPKPSEPAVPVAEGKTEPAPAAESESWLDKVSNNFQLLAGLAAAGLLGVGALLWKRGRRAKSAEEDLLVGSENTVFGDSLPATADTANSLFGTSDQPASYDPGVTEVDPVAEADVYIAYGRDEQAEEILREALRRTPERQAIRGKLLEILAKRQDVSGFNALASEMYGMTQGKGADWEAAAALGRTVDPGNALYDGSSASAPAQVAPMDDTTRLDLNLDTEFGATETIADEPDALEFDIPSFSANSPAPKASIPNVDLNLDGASAPESNQDPKWQEMATKLDLASAYEEIGDKDGARELLQEVVRGGDAAQISKAKDMLNQLG